MNKQSNTYTIIYIIVLVVLVGTALAATSLALRGRQQENINADKMSQILAAALITPQKDIGKPLTWMWLSKASLPLTAVSSPCLYV